MHHLPYFLLLQVLEWRIQYPHVSIKRSFQSANLNTAPNPLFLAPSLE